jgi:nitroreductase
MDIVTAMRKRRSIRRYKDKPVDQETLLDILEMARIAPSGANRQPWKLVVVMEPARRKDLVPLCKNQKFVEDCAAFVAGIADVSQRWSHVDLAIAMDHLSLAALDKGLGTCWIGAFDQEGLGSFLDVPTGMEVAVCMTIGYPNEVPDTRTRKSLGELVEWERFKGE